jgi:hypothetical protein
MSSGGGLTSVERRGETVRRSVGDWAAAVHVLLRHLETVGFGGAPRALGREAGVEILSFVPGGPPTHADDELERVGRLGPSLPRGDQVIRASAGRALAVHGRGATRRRGHLPQRPLARQHRLRAGRAAARVHRLGSRRAGAATVGSRLGGVPLRPALRRRGLRAARLSGGETGRAAAPPLRLLRPGRPRGPLADRVPADPRPLRHGSHVGRRGPRGLARRVGRTPTASSGSAASSTSRRRAPAGGARWCSSASGCCRRACRAAGERRALRFAPFVWERLVRGAGGRRARGQPQSRRSPELWAEARVRA